MKITEKQFNDAIRQFNESRDIITKYLDQLISDTKKETKETSQKQLRQVVCINNVFQGKIIKGLTLGKSYDVIIDPFKDYRAEEGMNEKRFAIKNDFNRIKYYSFNHKSDASLWEFIY